MYSGRISRALADGFAMDVFFPIRDKEHYVYILRKLSDWSRNLVIECD